MADPRVVAAADGPSKETLALASEVFDRFCAANTFRSILSLHRHLCDLLRIKPTNFPQFYPKIRGRLRSWKAEAIWAKYDKRASHKCYSRGRACPNTKVFVIGAGPCGLRTAIEAQLLGAKVVVVEKRDRISRNNVLHLWPFVIHDLRALGAKKFFGKFCAGSIDHISIRQLQCILLKVALLLGVEIHENVSFEGLIAPPEDQTERIGWRARIIPEDHPVSQYEFDVLIGADGKRNTLEGFKRKEFRGKLAIAITVNFINKHTEAEARVAEISGIAFIFRQKFFQEMRASTGIDLENIVYYKDETHYFVMTAKKHSLLAKGVILQDYPNTAKLLSPENVDREALLGYAREAANFATEGKLPHLEPAVNHHNQPDVAMFDFTSLYAAENASRVIERRGHRLLMQLVGDSLTEPFWPTGSGCARGFLSSMNGCWAIRSWGQLGPPRVSIPDTPTPPTSMIIDDDHVRNGDGNKENEMDSGGQKGTPKTPTTPHSPAPKRSVYAVLEVLAERESLYRLLGQVSPDNMSRDFDSYTLDPHTRYLSLNTQSVLPYQVRPLYDTDDRSALSFDPPVGPIPGISDHPKRRRKRDTLVHPDMLLQWLKRQVALYDGVTVEDMTKSFKNGLALCAVIHRYRPDLLDFHSLDPSQVAHNNQLAFDTLERELGIPPVMTGLEMEQCDVPDKLTMLTYLSQVYDTFRGEIPHIKHPKLQDDVDFLAEEAAAAAEAAALQQARLRKLGALSHSQKASFITRIVSSATHKPIPHPLVAYAKRPGTSSTPTSVISSTPVGSPSVAEPSSASLRRTRKRRSNDKAFTSAERREIQEEIARNRLERQRRRQYQRQLATQRFHKSLAMLQANARLAAGSDDDENSPFMDYNILFYRMTAPSFEDRVRDLESKINYPDRYARIQAEVRKGRTSKGGTVADPDFSGRVKNIEDKLKGNAPVEKRPKDLLRAIGKIEKSDWNVREIEKKMEENKMGKLNRQNQAERVPKWNQEKFQDKFMAVERKLCGKDNETPDKYAEIDRSLKHYDRKIKEGIAIEPAGPRGANKVSAMAEQFSTKPKDDTEAKEEAPEPSLPRSNSRGALVIAPQIGSKICHFCGKRVYLMERLSAEGCFFHRGCFRCEYCSTTLRLGNYAFDRDGKYGSHFFCVQHFGLQGLLNGAVRIGSKAINKGSGVSATGTKERHSRNRKSGAREKGTEETPAIEEKENAIQTHTPAKGKSSTSGTAGRKSGEGKRRSKGSGSKFGTPRITPAAVVEPVPFLTPPYIPEEEVYLGDRGTTPERIEFENTSIPVAEICKTDKGAEGNLKSSAEGEPSKRVASVEELPQMDEEEWINRNFGASAAEDASDDEDDDDSSDFSNDEAEVNVEVGGVANLGEDLAERRKKTWKGKGEKEVDGDEDEVFEEAMAEPLMTAEQTRLFAEKWKRRYSKDVVEDGGGDGQNGKEGRDEDEESSDSYESGESDDYEDEDEDEEDSDTATEGDEEEGEELVKARELRKQEFHLKVPERQKKAHGSGGDQGSDTEVNSEDYSTSDSDSEDDDDDDDDDDEEEEENSATEISTDSEFDDDRKGNYRHHEIPTIVIDESLLSSGINGDTKITLEEGKTRDVSPLVQPPRPTPRFVPLSRTHSTEGIASKVSLELKKRYLLGGGAGPSPPPISTTRRTILGTPAVPPAPALDSKLRCLADAISEHQKLLNPAPEPSAAMQTFLQKSSSTSDAQHHPLTPSSSAILHKDIESIRKRLLADYAAKTPTISSLSHNKIDSKETVIQKQGSDEHKKPPILTDLKPEDIVIINKSDSNAVSPTVEKLVNGICKKSILDYPLNGGVTNNKETVKSPTEIRNDLERISESSAPSDMDKAKKDAKVEVLSVTEKDSQKIVEESNTVTVVDIESNPSKVESSLKLSSEIIKEEIQPNISEVHEDQYDTKGEWVDCRPRSPVHETSIEVPKVNWNKVHGRDEDDIDEEDEDSLSEGSLQDDYDEEKDIDEAEIVEKVRPVPPVVVVEETAEEVEAADLEIILTEPVAVKSEFEEETKEGLLSEDVEENLKEKVEKPKESSMAEEENEVIIVWESPEFKAEEKENVLKAVVDGAVNVVVVENEMKVEQGQKSDKGKVETKREFTLLPLRKDDEISLAVDDEVPTPTETEELSSDWARDTDAANSVGEDLDLELCVNPVYVNTSDRKRRDKLRKKARKDHKKNATTQQWTPTTAARKAELEEDFALEPSVMAPPPLPSVPPPTYTHVTATPYCPEDIEFMDVGTEGSSQDDEREECQKRRRRRKGYSQLTDGSDPLAADIDDEGEVTPVAEDDDDEEDSSSDTVSGVKRSRTVEAVNCIAIGLAEEEEDGFSPAQDDTTTPSDAVTTVIESQTFASADAEEREEDDRLGGLALKSSPKGDECDEEYEGHVRRLKGRVSPFSNARDSIDIRKSRKQQKVKEISKSEPFAEKEGEGSSSESQPVIDSKLNGESISITNISAVESSSPSESLSPHPTSTDVESSFPSPPPASPTVSSTSSPKALNTPTIIRPYLNSPSTSRKLEEISRERSKQKDIIREMVIARIASEGGNRRSSSASGLDRRRGKSPRTSSSSICSPDSSTSLPAACAKETNKSPLAAVEPSPPSVVTESKRISILTPTRSLSMSTHFTPPSLSNLRAKMMQRRHSLHSQEPLPAESESSIDEVFSTPAATIGSPATNQTTGKIRPFSVHSTSRGLSSSTVGLGGILPDTPLTNPDAFSMPDIRRALFKTPSAPSRGSTEESLDVPVRPVRKKESTGSDKPGGLDYASSSKEIKADETESDIVNTGLTLGEERAVDVIMPTIVKATTEAAVVEVPAKKGNKDRERRKSIIQAVSDFFGGKKGSTSSTSTTSSTPSSPPPAALLTSPSPTSSVASPTHSVGKEGKDKGCDKFPRFPRLHPRSKGYKDKDKKVSLSDKGLTSGSEKDLAYHGNHAEGSKKVFPQTSTPEHSPPPVTLPPLNLPENVANRIAPKATEESFSEGEVVRKDPPSSTSTAVSTPSHDTPSVTSSMDSSASGLPLLGGKQSRQARRKARQAQLQRLRMAQEIQRQLEELEVKQRLLEKRGVSVEKALRGEEKDSALGAKLRMGSECLGDDDEDDDDDDDDGEEEAKLLHEWFELMRERSELRRCERELLVRAEELSLEDRHSRLQADLRDRLAQDDSTKTKLDVAREGEILGEMLEIVERRDSLMALLEEDRQRCDVDAPKVSRSFLYLLLLLHPSSQDQHIPYELLDNEALNSSLSWLLSLCGSETLQDSESMQTHAGNHGTSITSLCSVLLQFKLYLLESRSKRLATELSHKYMETSLHSSSIHVTSLENINHIHSKNLLTLERSTLPTLSSHLLLKLLSIYEAFGDQRWEGASVAIRADLKQLRSCLATMGLRKQKETRSKQTLDYGSHRRWTLGRTAASTFELSLASSLSTILALLIILWLFSYIAVWSFYS